MLTIVSFSYAKLSEVLPQYTILNNKPWPINLKPEAEWARIVKSVMQHIQIIQRYFTGIYIILEYS